MSKVDSLHSQPEPGLNRRGVLTGAAGLAALAAVATDARAAPDASPSAEFLELRKLHAEQYEVILVRSDIIDQDDPTGAAAGDAQIAEFDVKIDAVIKRINAKPPSIEAIVDCAAVFLLSTDDGCMASAFDDPDSVLLNPNSVRRNADALEIAGGQLASAVFALARQGGFNV